MTSLSTYPAQKSQMVRWIIKTLVFLLLSGAALFAAAGTFAWRQGWIYFSALALIQVLNGAVLIPLRPDLIAERSRMQEGTKPWDVALSMVVAMFGPLATQVAAGLDYRSGWTQAVHAGLSAAGLVFIVLGGLLALYAMVSNPFFAATVRIQDDRGHKVATGGPYRWIRHPGYAGGLLYNLTAPLALSSWWAFIPSLLTAAALVLRTYLEDQTLQKELDGYLQYSRQVRYRLAPWIW